jgi:NADH dehydrogenase [ubiquinone] 1 alpha subcomplex assembly factor 2
MREDETLSSSFFFRNDPPTQEELLKNLAIMQMKKKNAATLEDKHKQPQDHAALKHDQTTGRAHFPRYDDDYELMPGAAPIAKKDKE